MTQEIQRSLPVTTMIRGLWPLTGISDCGWATTPLHRFVRGVLFWMTSRQSHVRYALREDSIPHARDRVRHRGQLTGRRRRRSESHRRLMHLTAKLPSTNTTVVSMSLQNRGNRDSRLTAVRWRNTPQGGSLVLTTATEKVRIYLDNFEPEDRVWLIRHFRNGVSEGLQDGWALFCHKIALPLRDKSTPPHAVLDLDSVRITRRRWDWYFLPINVVSLILAPVVAWRLEQPRLLAFPILPAVLWLCMRGMTPREGLVAERITSRPEVVGYLVFMAWWLGVAVAGVVLFRIWSPLMPAAAIIGGTALVLWYAVLFWRCYQLDRVRRKRDETNAVVSIRRWNEGEAAGKEFNVDEPTSHA